tara:strand:+ start:450 stop:800 length:351 start_codon:yes stop_codon:yes gene_type:complete
MKLTETNMIGPTDVGSLSQFNSSTPMNNYLNALKAVKESDFSTLRSCLALLPFSRAQLSELLIHASGIRDGRIAQILIENGASPLFDNHLPIIIHQEYNKCGEMENKKPPSIEEVV